MQFVSPSQADWDQKTAQTQETATRLAMNPQPRVRQAFSAFRTKSATFFSGKASPQWLDRPKFASQRAPPDFTRSR
jgi:hypothetical protein